MLGISLMLTLSGFHSETRISHLCDLMEYLSKQSGPLFYAPSEKKTEITWWQSQTQNISA